MHDLLKRIAVALLFSGATLTALPATPPHPTHLTEMPPLEWSGVLWDSGWTPADNPVTWPGETP